MKSDEVNFGAKMEKKTLGHYTDSSNADRDKGQFYCATCAEMVGDHADITIHKVRTPAPCPYGHHIVDLDRV